MRIRPRLHVVDLTHVSIFEQLKWEEALLRADERNWCILNQGSPPAIVIGISGKKEEWVQTKKFSQSPLPLIRRCTGGGCVVVDENTLFVTLICQSNALPISPFPRPLSEWMAELYRSLLHPHPFALKENDYTFNDKKWGGNAQAITKSRWMHHSSLLWDYKPANMEYLALPPKMPLYREKRGHENFLCRLRDFWPHACSFQELFRQKLAGHFDLVEKSEKELNEIALLPHRKATRLE